MARILSHCICSSFDELTTLWRAISIYVQLFVATLRY